MIPKRAVIGSLAMRLRVSSWIFSRGIPAAFALLVTLEETSKRRRMRWPVDCTPRKLMPFPNPPLPAAAEPAPAPIASLVDRDETWSAIICDGSSGNIWSSGRSGSAGSEKAVGRELCNLSLKVGFGAMASSAAMFILCSRFLAGRRMSRWTTKLAGGGNMYFATTKRPATTPAAICRIMTPIRIEPSMAQRRFLAPAPSERNVSTAAIVSPPPANRRM